MRVSYPNHLDYEGNCRLRLNVYRNVYYTYIRIQLYLLLSPIKLGLICPVAVINPNLAGLHFIYFALLCCA
jgi:hypothetical protein